MLFLIKKSFPMLSPECMFMHNKQINVLPLLPELCTRESLLKGRISTDDLLALTSLLQLLLILNYIFSFRKTTYLNEEVNCTEPSHSVSVPCLYRIQIFNLNYISMTLPREALLKGEEQYS